ncbi:MAG: tRNA guanosine(34) transglycosylase Tgt [Planctomycetia bacterium]|nr:tRNA guanosine(34) transglycosylase Tgt [Planctomycetia bacterium]
MNFNVLKTDINSSARTGILKTDHGVIQTPIFMPIGTHGAVKTVTPRELQSVKTQIILGNTYHLYLRPGTELINQAGGLHKFMGWDLPILTDSGGFQVFSLARLNKITNEGVEFQSHLDGSRHFLTPEKSMEIQRDLGADIIMAFDECPPGDADIVTINNAVKRTKIWISKCQQYLEENPPVYHWEQTMFPIVQGGVSPELRKRSAEDMIPFAKCGMAIGGLAVGEEKPAMFEMIGLMDEVLPKDQPRYLMGVGTPSDLIKAVSCGIDMFDCVIPTRNGRNGQLFTSFGKINIRNEKYKFDFIPVDENCYCETCANFSRSYLRHLFNINEVLGLRLATVHNLYYYLNLMELIRSHIQKGDFQNWSQNYLDNINKDS